MKAILTKYSDCHYAHVILIPESGDDKRVLNEGNMDRIEDYAENAIKRNYPNQRILSSEPLDDEKQNFLCLMAKVD